MLLLCACSSQSVGSAGPSAAVNETDAPAASGPVSQSTAAPTDTPSPEHSAAPTQTKAPESSAKPTPTPTPTPATRTEIQPAEEIIEDDETPLANGGAWALLNLIITILTALGSIIMLVGYFGKKREAEKDEDGNVVLDENGEEKTEYTVKKKGFWRLFSLVPTVVAIIAFILTEDMSLPMAFVDKWTILMLLIGLAQVGVAILSRKAKEEAEEETPAEV